MQQIETACDAGRSITPASARRCAANVIAQHVHQRARLQLQRCDGARAKAIGLLIGCQPGAELRDRADTRLPGYVARHEFDKRLQPGPGLHGGQGRDQPRPFHLSPASALRDQIERMLHLRNIERARGHCRPGRALGAGDEPEAFLAMEIGH